VKVAANSKCGHCGAGAELGVTSSAGAVVLLCRRCTKKLAKRLGMPSLLKQLERDDPN
jgi:hypothetical protein